VNRFVNGALVGKREPARLPSSLPAAEKAAEPADAVEREAYLIARANQDRKPWARRWLKANGYWL
jgi:hypothetical protein